MLIVLNGYDWVGQALLNSNDASTQPIVHVETVQCVRQMALLVEDGMPAFEYKGYRYSLSACQAIYCGHTGQSVQILEHMCQHSTDRTYINSAWNAWLLYWCARIPRRVGVLPDTLWLGTLLHLPALYQRAAAFGITVPLLRYTTQAPMVLSEQARSGWYGLKSVRPNCIDDFGPISDSTRIVVQHDEGNWVQLLVVGAVVMAVRLHDDGHWHRYDLPAFIQRLIVRLVVSYDLTIATVFMRLEHAGTFSLYALDWNISGLFQPHYSQDVLHAVKEMLYDD